MIIQPERDRRLLMAKQAKNGEAAALKPFRRRKHLQEERTSVGDKKALQALAEAVDQVMLVWRPGHLAGLIALAGSCRAAVALEGIFRWADLFAVPPLPPQPQGKRG